MMLFLGSEVTETKTCACALDALGSSVNDKAKLSPAMGIAISCRDIIHSSATQRT